MARFFVGDAPLEPWPVPSHEIDLTPFTGAEVRLISPLGVQVPGPVAELQADEDTVLIKWPDAPVLDTKGLWRLEVVVTKGARRETLPMVLVAVEQDTGWHTLDSARQEWADGPLDDALLFTLLEAAKDQCEAFAPVLTGAVPLRYRAAQLMQTRSLWQSGSVNQDGALGGGDMTVTVFPMDWTVKALLRPKRAVGGMF